MATDGQQSNDPQDTSEQGTGQDTGQGGQERTGQQQGTPTPRDVQQRGSDAPAASGDASASDGEQQHASLDDLPDWAQREIRDLRGENAQRRTSQKTAEEQAQQQADEKLQRVLEALGVEKNDDETPEKAAERDRQAREQAEADAKTARLELAVHRAAPKVNADATALLDSRAFTENARDLDPTDSDAIRDAIKAAVDENPRLAATQAAARNSADFTGGSGDGAITTEKFKGMNLQQRQELYRSDPNTYRRLAAQR